MVCPQLLSLEIFSLKTFLGKVSYLTSMISCASSPDSSNIKLDAQ